MIKTDTSHKIARSKQDGCRYCRGGRFSDLAYDFEVRCQDVGFFCKWCGRPIVADVLAELERGIGGNDE